MKNLLIKTGLRAISFGILTISSTLFAMDSDKMVTEKRNLFKDFYEYILQSNFTNTYPEIESQETILDYLLRIKTPRGATCYRFMLPEFQKITKHLINTEDDFILGMGKILVELVIQNNRVAILLKRDYGTLTQISTDNLRYLKKNATEVFNKSYLSLYNFRDTLPPAIMHTIKDPTVPLVCISDSILVKLNEIVKFSESFNFAANLLFVGGHDGKILCKINISNQNTLKFSKVVEGNNFQECLEKSVHHLHRDLPLLLLEQMAVNYPNSVAKLLKRMIGSNPTYPLGVHLKNLFYLSYLIQNETAGNQVITDKYKAFLHKNSK